MFRGLYAAGTAMVVNTRKMEIVSNNLANIDTIAYKKDILLTESFEEILISKRNGVHSNLNYSTEGFSYKESNGVFTIESPKAFMKLDGKTRLNFSRSAKLHVDEKGFLSTFYKDGNGNIHRDRGNRIYGKNGHIQVGTSEVSFDDKGNVLLDGNIVDNILVVPGKHIIGTAGSGIIAERTETQFEQGQLERTDYEFDFALDGEGFFEVETPNGNLYTRDGRFKLNNLGEIVTIEGFNVVGLNGPIQMEGITVATNEFGEIMNNGETIDKFKITNIKNSYELSKAGGGYYRFENNYELEEENFVGKLRQGYVEKSNSDNLAEMIALLELNRNYQSNQKMITSYDSIIDKAVNQIGRL